ncbi:MAG: amino acid ABC transporter substrate-binding protein [Thermodesulfobacteriota bacterium]|nr:amino acid ABC transporter substrate-binding protein [Thermodesulfobacteriota bacterium]
MKKRKSFFWTRGTIIFSCCLILISFPTFVNSQEAKVRIGAAVSMTGRLAKEGSLVKKGYETWTEWVNGRGGINVGGKLHKVEMIYYDDKADATTSAKLTEKLITEDKVNLILGPYSSGIAAATSAIGEKYGYVTIAPVANGDFVYERGFKYLFSVLSMATQDLVPVAELAVKQIPKPKTFAAVVLDHVFTLPAIDGVKKKSLESGLQEVYYGKFPVNTSDFSGILTTIKGKDPDLLYFGGFFPDAVSFYRQAKELNVNAKLYTTTGTAGHPDWLSVMKKDGEYVLAQVPWHQDMPYKGPFFTSASFNDFWKKKYGEEADYFSACGFVSGILMQLAIEKAGSLDQTKIRDVLRAIDVETFFGKFKFDEKGKNIAHRMGIIQVQSGKQVLIDPPQPGAKILYPAPSWKER